MQHFSSDGVDIAWREAGEGEPILLIHGFASNYAVNWESTNWFHTLIEAGRRVIAMDVRGHGKSGKVHDPAAYQPAVMAQDAANLIDRLGLGPVDVMGYSMGARIATLLALDNPGKVRRLVIGGMGYGLVQGIGGEDEIVAALEAPSLEEATGPAGRGYRKFAEQTRSDLPSLAACMRAQRQPIAAERLATLTIPVLIAVGEKDGVAGSPEALGALIPGSEVFVIPNRDHMLATGDKAFKAAVLDFFRRR